MNKKAFTLIELLVVIAIIGILSSVIYTNITGLRDRAKVTAGIRFDSSILHSIGDRLLGEWVFDSQSQLIDTSGAGNTLTNGGGATFATTSGYNGKGAFSFNGTSNYLWIAAPSGQNLSITTDKVTVSAWINPNSTQAGTIVCKNQPYILALGDQHFYAGVGTGSWLFVSGNSVIPLNTWSFVTMVYDGAKISLYLNGNFDGSIAKTGNLLYWASDFYIGYGTPGVDQYFSGLIDDVRIYESALTSSEIQKLYAERKAGYEVATK
ncbi:MAG: LamG-like jellyroll fold domain-containing protein [Candidatus Paceibacterota bacterium]|jgi:prepilin-type N-terminal cleavage/methylation domain-containing protein